MSRPAHPTLGDLHEHGVKGYLTMNTLVFDEGLGEAEALSMAQYRLPTWLPCWKG